LAALAERAARQAGTASARGSRNHGQGRRHRRGGQRKARKPTLGHIDAVPRLPTDYAMQAQMDGERHTGNDERG
jgi:hypothetical protein